MDQNQRRHRWAGTNNSKIITGPQKVPAKSNESESTTTKKQKTRKSGELASTTTAKQKALESGVDRLIRGGQLNKARAMLTKLAKRFPQSKAVKKLRLRIDAAERALIGIGRHCTMSFCLYRYKFNEY